jgi:hypothetical protein
MDIGIARPPAATKFFIRPLARNANGHKFLKRLAQIRVIRGRKKCDKNLAATREAGRAQLL